MFHDHDKLIHTIHTIENTANSFHWFIWTELNCVEKVAWSATFTFK